MKIHPLRWLFGPSPLQSRTAQIIPQGMMWPLKAALESLSVATGKDGATKDDR
jgi:hypothetical protein